MLAPPEGLHAERNQLTIPHLSWVTFGKGAASGQTVAQDCHFLAVHTRKGALGPRCPRQSVFTVEQESRPYQ
jgi:hypothetical protein